MIKIFHVDAFTNKPFTGNPAAVCILPGPAHEEWMQNVAKEMNLSETAFLYRQDDGFNLRWFTPAVEVSLCGHATLASAHILWEECYLKPEEDAQFHTKSGILKAFRNGEYIEMNFPAIFAKLTTPPSDLAKALGVKPKHVSRTKFDYLIEVESEEVLRNIKPDFELLKAIPSGGIIVTSLADSKQYDFVSRYFAPREGINEDPVTGSAHCALAPYWQAKLNKSNFTAYQASSRGGVVRIKVNANRVFLSGQAVTISQGELVINGR